MIGLLATTVFIVPLIGSLVLFGLDEREADIIMLLSFLTALISQFGVVYLFRREAYPYHLHADRKSW